MRLENLSLIDAFYYNIVTMSTVGYGDIHPTQISTRLLAVFIIVLGGGTFIGFVANATEMLLMQRDMKSRLKKQNIVLGIFFSEMGNHLLSLFAQTNTSDNISSELSLIDLSHSEKTLTSTAKKIKKESFNTVVTGPYLDELNMHLKENRSLILGLLENPALFEQERFTEMLLAVAHLNEELQSRPDLHKINEVDQNHLCGDINRAYVLLVEEWLRYLIHLKKHYPYLFSLAARKNPFNPEASVIFPENM